MDKTAQNLIAAMDDLLNEKPSPRPDQKSFAEYWAGSASASVMRDYKNGNVRDV